MLGKKLTLHDLTKIQLEGKRVVMRVDYNVPFDKQGNISNNQRIQSTIPTIREIFEKGAKSICLLSHLGRPDGRVQPKSSLAPVAKRLEELIGQPVIFVNDCIGEEVDKITANPEQGSIILLENVRFHPEEEGAGVDEKGEKFKVSKEAIAEFSAKLTKLGDVYINDAFGTAHRAHASMVGVNLPIRAAGNLVKLELDAFVPVLENPTRPLLSILGGAKVSDKIKLIENLLDKVDEMIICGGMAYTFLKVLEGTQIGKSLFDVKGAEIVQDLMKKAQEKGVKIHLPVDFVCGDEFKADCQIQLIHKSVGIPETWQGLDIGPESIKLFQEVVLRARTIIWNGPAGVYEWEKFQAGTRGLLDSVAEVKEKHSALTVIGGGDAATCAMSWGYTQKISHISTGGGASLELLEGRVMPGLYALSDK